MLYLTSKYDKERKISFDETSDDHWEMLSWVMFQMGGIGPMQGSHAAATAVILLLTLSAEYRSGKVSLTSKEFIPLDRMLTVIFIARKQSLQSHGQGEVRVRHPALRRRDEAPLLCAGVAPKGSW